MSGQSEEFIFQDAGLTWWGKLLNSVLKLNLTWLFCLFPSQAHQSWLSYLISEELSHRRPFNDEQVTCDQLWSKLSILISRQKTHQMHQLSTLQATRRLTSSLALLWSINWPFWSAKLSLITLNRASSVPNTWTVEAGCLARLINEPACDVSLPPTTRHRRMEAVRMRKANQIYTADEHSHNLTKRNSRSAKRRSYLSLKTWFVPSKINARAVLNVKQSFLHA